MKENVRLGQCWIVRLSKCEMAVRIDDYRPQGGWIVRSLIHGRKLWVGKVDQLLRRCDHEGLDLVADEVEPNRRSYTAIPVPEFAPEEQPDKLIEMPEPEFPRLPPKPPEPVQPATLLDAVVIVLRGRRQGLSTKEIIDAVQEKELWTTTGKTPWLTLHTILTRDIKTHGTESRFKKSRQRGKFMLR